MVIDICAGWLPTSEKIGELKIARSHGREVLSVEYDNNWLIRHNVMLDPDLALYSGVQYPYGKDTFGFLSDAMPDRWGRKLIEKEERLLADREKRPVRTLTDADYLLKLSDKLRYGGIRFRNAETGRYFSDTGTDIPPLTDIRMLEEAVHGYELSDKDESALRILIDQGSSLGGARPKANVRDQRGALWIAKFPSQKDDYNVGAWEMAEHQLAVKCGLKVPDAKIIRLSENGSTFLTKRFDRDDSGNRIHLMSAMTALGMTDGNTDGTSYIDLAGQIEQISVTPEMDMQELWKRMVFNILTSNCDDHLRNHGFILREDGWHLSPAFDLNPTIQKDVMSLNITDNDNRKNVSHAIAVAELFRIPEENAKEIVQDMQNVIRSNWRGLASQYRIPEKDMTVMAPAFSECDRKIG